MNVIPLPLAALIIPLNVAPVLRLSVSTWSWVRMKFESSVIDERTVVPPVLYRPILYRKPSRSKLEKQGCRDWSSYRTAYQNYYRPHC